MIRRTTTSEEEEPHHDDPHHEDPSAQNGDHLDGSASQVDGHVRWASRWSRDRDGLRVPLALPVSGRVGVHSHLGPENGTAKDNSAFPEQGHLHELTFSCYRRMPLLTNDSWLEKLARCIDSAGEETATDLVGFVFMPEHIHLLVYPKDPDPPIGRYLARLKQPFSKQIKEILV